MSPWFEKVIQKTQKKYLSYSSVKHFLDDVVKGEMYLQGKLKKDSQAFTFGAAYDVMLFTPDEFDNQFFVLEEEDILGEIGGKNPRATKVYKEWLKEQEALAVGKRHLSAEEHQQAIDMITRLEDSGVREIYLKGEYQVEFNKELEIGNHVIPFRGFLDVLGDGFITDLKSTRASNMWAFKRDVKSMGYDVQSYLYTKAFGIDDYWWVAQNKFYPYLPMALKCSEDTLDSGRRKVEHALNVIKDYALSDKPSTHFYIQGEI
mgnify:FL=1|tara:strand:+ start:2307 stop:3089 length:783 start_codon:yes stop_codon:yes gene_type:complete